MADAPARLDRAGDEQVHTAADDVHLAATFEADVGRDRDDAPVLVAAAPHELGEHADLARRPVVDDRAVEPRDESVRRPKSLGVDAIDGVDADVGQLGEVLVRDEAVEALRPQARGKGVEPRAFGLGEKRSGYVEAHESRTLHTGEREPEPGADSPVVSCGAILVSRTRTVSFSNLLTACRRGKM